MFRQAGSSSTQKAFPEPSVFHGPFEPLCSLYLGSIKLGALRSACSHFSHGQDNLKSVPDKGSCCSTSNALQSRGFPMPWVECCASAWDAVLSTVFINVEKS